MLSLLLGIAENESSVFYLYQEVYHMFENRKGSGSTCLLQGRRITGARNGLPRKHGENQVRSPPD